MNPAQTIEIRKELPLWKEHLFVNENGDFGWKANTWESPVFEKEMAAATFVGFLRNIPRKAWALCVPFGPINDQPFYPDLLVFHRKKAKLIIDILEPHSDAYADHSPKAQGLAVYAMNHGELFGRIEMIRLVKGKSERLDMLDEKIRTKVLKATTADQLKDLYEEFG